MCRSHLHRTHAEFHIDKQRICDHWNFATHERYHDLLTNVFLIALIAWMHRKCGIAQHCLGARGGYGNKARTIGETILEGPEMTLHCFMINFIVGHCCLQMRIPIY